MRKIICSISLAFALVLPFQTLAAQALQAPAGTIWEGREHAIRRGTPACEAAYRYVVLVNLRRYAEIGSLFAGEVDYIGPDGRPLHRGADVGALYARLGPVHQDVLQGRIYSLIPIGQRECILEFGTPNPETHEFQLAAVDHFFVGRDGKVTRFLAYFQTAHHPPRG
jgi:hypothetical protein